jgi:hypothetical protein
VGGKFQKGKKKKLGGGQGENKVARKKVRSGEKKLGEKIKLQKKKLRSGGKKTGKGTGRKLSCKKKTEIRAEKGQRKKVNLGWHRDRKRNLFIHPRWCTGGCWFTEPMTNRPSCANRTENAPQSRVAADGQLQKNGEENPPFSLGCSGDAAIT